MSARRNGLLALTAALAASVGGSWSQDHATRLTVLAVGQGDCTVLQHRGQVAVIDVGGKAEDFDAGERLVAPGLRRLGVDKIDLLILTHPDADHVGGLSSVLKRYEVGEIVANARFRDHAEMRYWLTDAGVPPSRVRWLSGTAVADLAGAGLRIHAAQTRRTVSDNDGSLFILIEADGARAAITGDASEAMEMAMLDSGVSWRAELLKAGHHGSASSTCSAWLSKVQPTYVVASCGRGNRYGHPHPSVERRAAAARAQFFRTDRDGTLTFRVRGGKFRPS